jgi:hypothetical protein
MPTFASHPFFQSMKVREGSPSDIGHASSPWLPLLSRCQHGRSLQVTDRSNHFKLCTRLANRRLVKRLPFMWQLSPVRNALHPILNDDARQMLDIFKQKDMHQTCRCMACKQGGELYLLLPALFVFRELLLTFALVVVGVNDACNRVKRTYLWKVNSVKVCTTPGRKCSQGGDFGVLP